ncbi:MAG: hypothetical protein J2P26_03165 [Nocardiopsaceae bacterium]|nr:hypothetical protein [Nocardiopsaceae bacterium]
MVSEGKVPAGERAGSSAGERLFARYAYAPNHLGYCGPADTAALAELAETGSTDADIRAIASRFSGAWPYMSVLAELAGIDDPLDERVVRAYWTGGDLLSTIDNEEFGRKLLDWIGGQAGHYWSHLTADLLPEAVPTHTFHVFGVYPWTRLLKSPTPEPAVQVLDSCRIRWGRVTSVSCDSGSGSGGYGKATIVTSHLTWDGERLGLGEDVEEKVEPGFVAAPRPGEWLAVHWDHASDRLTDDEVGHLKHWTQWQLTATNKRLNSP